MEPTHLPDTREWWGYGYVHVGADVGKVVHSSMACFSGKRIGTDTRVYRVQKLDDGKLIIRSTLSQERDTFTVTECPNCPPPINWDWHKQAACYGQYPAVDMHDRAKHKENIEQFCNQCPVVLQCLDFADVHQQRGGIYGGTWIGEFNTHADEAIRKQRLKLST